MPAESPIVSTGRFDDAEIIENALGYHVWSTR